MRLLFTTRCFCLCLVTSVYLVRQITTQRMGMIVSITYSIPKKQTINGETGVAKHREKNV